MFSNARPTFGASICDVDGNGYMDILTVSSSGYDNKLWLNLFDKKKESRVFVNYGQETGYAEDIEKSFSKKMEVTAFIHFVVITIKI